MHNELHVRTARKRELIDLTDEVAAFVSRCGLDTGACLVFVRHTTAALVINDVSESFVHDFLLALEAFPNRAWTHLHAGPEHAKDHLLGAALGESKTLPVVRGRLALGTWQRLYLVELDGPRNRDVLLMTIPA
ncbi:MAG TPA: secondary thiamine-phosphate synthase enzyme YjbQ [Chloroflexia bacterium]|nr:secondary thiamine-phosphate synthase enzyme YjbQ [Chloroflexia bacterium]